MKLGESIGFISAGTLSTLTGFFNYSQIDVIRTSFEKFADSIPQDLLWQEAWYEYIISSEWKLLENTLKFN